MKKMLKLLIVLSLIAITFIFCNNIDKNNASKVAEQFVRNLYTLDTKQLAKYNTFKNSSSAADRGQNLQLLLNDFKPLMTDEWYRKFMANCEYIAIINRFSPQNDYTVQIVQPILIQRFYDNKENKIGYNYKAKIKIISNKDKKEQTGTAEGYVGLIKENGQWKIYADELYNVNI